MGTEDERKVATLKPHEMYLAQFYYGTVAILASIVLVAGVLLIKGIIKNRKKDSSHDEGEQNKNA